MKIAILTAFIFVSQLAGANQTFDEILGAYSSSSLNEDCSLAYVESSDNTTVSIASKNAGKLQLVFTQKTIHYDGNTYLIQETDYPGTGTALFVERPYKLIVFLNWESKEGGEKKSAFCELQKK